MGTKLPSSMSTLPIAMCVEYCKERQGRAEIKNVLLAFLATMLSSQFFFVPNVDNVHKNMEADTLKWSFSHDVGDVHLC